MFKTGCNGGDGYDGCVSDDGCDSCVSCGSCYSCIGCYGCYGRYGCGGCVCVSSYWCRAYCSECNFVRISTRDASTRSHNTLSKFVDRAESHSGASDGISPSVALTLATPAAYYAGCCGYPAGSASCCGYTTEGGSIGVASAVADGTGAFACSLSFFARVMAFFAAKFSPDNEARCGYSWQRRTNNDEQRGSSRTALKTICAASTAGSGAQTRASNAACTTSNRATRQRLKGLATRSAAHTAGSGRHEQQRATSNRTGALRIQLAAPHKQRRATRLVRNSTGDELRCEYSWQRRTNTHKQRGYEATSNRTCNEARCADSWQRASRTTTSSV